MREALNFDMIPIVQDNINGFNPDIGRSLTNISSNGYYGYQSPHQMQQKTNNDTSNNNNNNHMDTCCDMDIQYTNSEENQEIRIQNGVSPLLVNRKRHWNDINEFSEFKKRRQNEPDSLTSAPQQLPQKAIHLRKPTHNIPDLSRCIMGHYI